jgi:hypothetical protein
VVAVTIAGIQLAVSKDTEILNAITQIPTQLKEIFSQKDNKESINDNSRGTQVQNLPPRAPIAKDYFFKLGSVVKWMTDEYDETMARGAKIIFNADFQPENGWVLQTPRFPVDKSGDKIAHKGEEGTLWIPDGANAFSID